MNYLFITQIFDIKISNTLKKGKVTRPGARITNCFDEIDRVLQNNIFINNIGYFSYQEFSSYEGVHYIATGKFNEEIGDSDKIGSSFCGVLLREVQHFLHELWREKDHGGYVRDGFLLIYNNEYEDGLLYRASLSEIYVKANISREITFFNTMELDNAIKNWEGYELPTVKETEKGSLEGEWKHPTPIYFQKDTENKPVGRFYFNIVAARASSITPMKILYYCAALESLFSFEKSPEIAYRISERTALCIGENLEDKKYIFDLVKKAYDVRSKVIHGNFFKNNELEQQRKLSLQIDELLRRVSKFVERNELDFNNSEACKDYFLNAVLQ